MAVVWVRILHQRRLLQRRGIDRIVNRYELVGSTEPIMVPSASPEEAPVVQRVRPYFQTLVLRQHRGQLYRPILDDHDLYVATMASVAQADARSLSVAIAHGLDDDNRADYSPLWRDHPARIDDDLMAPDDPWLKARLASDRVPPYWRVVEDRRDSAIEGIQRMLGDTLLVNGLLHRRTASPGLFLQADDRGLTFEGWLPGVTHRWPVGVFLDWQDVAGLDAAAAVLTRRGTPIVEGRRLPTLGSYRGGGPFADAAMVRLGLRALKEAAGRTISALGPDLALLFWEGVAAATMDDVERARSWQDRARTLFSRSGQGNLAATSRLLEARLAAVAEAGV